MLANSVDRCIITRQHDTNADTHKHDETVMVLRDVMLYVNTSPSFKMHDAGSSCCACD